jgi:hypothetical protein
MANNNFKHQKNAKNLPKNDAKRLNREVLDEVKEAKYTISPNRRVNNSNEVQVIYPVKTDKPRYSNNNTQNVDQSPDTNNS